MPKNYFFLKKTIFCRFAWTMSFILSITACSFMVYQLNQKFIIDSTSIVSSHRIMNISEFPFPAVSVMSLILFNMFLEGSVIGNELSIIILKFVPSLDSSRPFQLASHLHLPRPRVHMMREGVGYVRSS